MTESIQVRWPGGEATFEAGSVVRLGRDPASDVQLPNDHVSRRHAELGHTADGWVLDDVGSAQGTWVDGRRTSSVAVPGPLTVSLGQPPNGALVELVPLGAPQGSGRAGTVLPGAGLPGTVLPGASPLPPPPAAAPAPGAPPPPGAGTVVVGGDPERPGGRLREGAAAGATVVTGDSLNVECAGRSYTFQPGREVVIGRDEGSDVVTTNPTVSRRHAVLRHDGGSWVLQDAGSASGTFVDGSRITTRSLSGSTAAWLGPVDTGERIVLVTSGPTARPPRSARPLLLVGAAVVGVVAIVALVVALLGRDSGGGPDDDKLARATVLIETEVDLAVPGGTCTVSAQGSGSIIDREDGLVLTNAHVVAPSAEGLEQVSVCDDQAVLGDPDVIGLAVTPGLDQPAEPAYVASVVAVDGYLDLAVIRIERTIGGRLLEPGDFDELVEVELGDSDDVSTGDVVNVLGFPAAAQSTAATLSTGVVSGVVGEAELDTNRGFFNVDARISSGNSGGLAADDRGRLIGVPTILRADTVGSVRPVNLALPLIDAARADETYVSPYG